MRVTLCFNITYVCWHTIANGCWDPIWLGAFSSSCSTITYATFVLLKTKVWPPKCRYALQICQTVSLLGGGEGQLWGMVYQVWVREAEQLQALRPCRLTWGTEASTYLMGENSESDMLCPKNDDEITYAQLRCHGKKQLLRTQPPWPAATPTLCGVTLGAEHHCLPICWRTNTNYSSTPINV